MHLQFLLNLHLYCTVGWVKCHTPGGFRAKVINLAQLTNAVTKVKSRVCLAFHPAGVFVELNWTLQRGRRWLGVAALPCRNAAVLMCAASVACRFSKLFPKPQGRGRRQGVGHLKARLRQEVAGVIQSLFSPGVQCWDYLGNFGIQVLERRDRWEQIR